MDEEEKQYKCNMEVLVANFSLCGKQVICLSCFKVSFLILSHFKLFEAL